MIENLQEILEKHVKWLRDENGGERADLRYANLRYADLSNANLRYADLRYANLRYANLRYADLRYADLSYANLSYANLSYADLSYADIEERIKQKFYPLVCPEVGSFIGWKTNNDYIIKLQITETALRSSAYGRKCRASEALVLAIENKDGTPAEVQEVFSTYDEEFAYHVGDLVKPRFDFDPDRWNECSSGIHFFITRQEAVDYNA